MLVEKIATPILVFLFSLILFSCSSESEKFDSNEWKNDAEGRYRMVENLVESKLLIGKYKEEVIELLGPDTEQGPCNNCIGFSTNNPDQGFSIDHEVLEINFDYQNKVTDVRINAW